MSRGAGVLFGLAAIAAGTFLLVADTDESVIRQPTPVAPGSTLATTTVPPTTTTTRAHPEGVDVRLDVLPHSDPSFRIDWRWDTRDPEEWIAYLEVELLVTLNSERDLDDYLSRLREAKGEALTWIEEAGLGDYTIAWLPEEAATEPAT